MVGMLTKTLLKNMKFKVLCTYYTRLQMYSNYYGMVYTQDTNANIIYLKVLGVQSLHYFLFQTSVKIFSWVENFLWWLFYRWEPVTGCRDWCSAPITSHLDFLSLGDPSSCRSLSQEPVHSQIERGMLPVHVTHWSLTLMSLDIKTACGFILYICDISCLIVIQKVWYAST